jgi:autotransporter-associated beta strand protein
MKISINNNQKTPRQNPARGILARPVAALITALFVTVLLGGTSVQAVQYWKALSETDWSSSTNNWSTTANLPTHSDQVVFTNGVACDYGTAVDTNYSVNLIYVGGGGAAAPTNSNTTGILNITNGMLWVTNQAAYNLVVGGSGQNFTNGLGGSNSVGTLTVSGGTLNVAVSNNPAMSKDSVILGLGTNSTGTLTITNNGTANFLCGLEMGVNGYGTLNVGGNGTLLANGWFTVGRGQQNSGIASSGTFNMSGGTVYILPNAAGGTPPSAINGGLCMDNYSTNSTVNISGGTLYADRIGLLSYTNLINGVTITNTDTLNISGGTLYIGDGGVNSNLMTAGGSSVSYQSVNISGGTFHTADMLQSNTNGIAGTWGVEGAITNVTGLTDGTNWTWAANPPVNLTNSSFTVNGVTGPGYVTFAPETNRTITLKNVWSGVGGMNIAGPGTVLLTNAVSTYTGNTVISGGTLACGANGGLSASPKIIVAGGAIFDMSLHPFTLPLGLTVSNSSSTAILAGNINSGTATAALTYQAGTPSFAVANGTLTLSAGTVLNINNTGSKLVPGTYTIIGTTGVLTNGVEMGTNGIVAGVVPSSYTVGGNGVNGASSLIISTSHTLDLVVVASAQPPVIGNSVTNTVTSGDMWQIAISSLSNSAAWSDPNSDTVTLSSVGPLSTNGVSVTNNANNIYYTVPVTVSDKFSYIITNTTALTATGMVYLVVTPALSSIISLPAVNISGNPILSGTLASSNTIYGVESTTNLSTVPGSWIEAGTTTTGPTGSWTFTDTNQVNPPTIFYRLYNPDDPGSPPQ